MGTIASGKRPMREETLPMREKSSVRRTVDYREDKKLRLKGIGEGGRMRE